ncbi:MAG: hypothetical protein ABSA44_09610 [Bacteroidota bacterium]|jgi:hypothetical protein
MKTVRGGYSLVEFDSDVNFTNAHEITALLKAGTSIVPKTPTEEFADGTNHGVLKQMDLSIRSANVDNAAGSAYALLKAAELAGTLLNFRYIGLGGGILIEDCEDAWDENVAANVTSTADTDCKVGSHAAKLAVGDAVAAGTILATEAITALDLSTRKEISLWIKSSITINASDLQLLLDDTANCASPLESLNIPALVANAWTKIALTLANPGSDTAIISVGVKMVVDKGAFNLFIDDVRGIADNVIVKNVPPVVEFEANEIGKFNAMKVTGSGLAVSESDLINLNV